uniref:Uncharacterized protein n=1 Tax=Grateloupia filicina TaxID=31455 RepID=A0A2S1FXC1_9FLOR|nr:hypothetical protein Grafi_p222 [Grateloupia filicina]AWD77413.1 hypothetical protein Grafi_p222 [Grateloupia filicina]
MYGLLSDALQELKNILFKACSSSQIQLKVAKGILIADGSNNLDPVRVINRTSLPLYISQLVFILEPSITICLSLLFFYTAKDLKKKHEVPCH